MTNRLIIRLPGQAEGQVPWLLLGQDNVALEQGVLSHCGELATLNEIAAAAEVMVLVSSTEVGFHHLQLPPGSRRHLAQVVPYALEEELAQDLQELHFAWHLPADKSAPLPVAVVAKAQMEIWQDCLQQAGIRSKRLIPDMFMLPLASDEWSAMSLDNEIVVRHQDWRGFAIEESLFAELAGLFSGALEPPQRIRCWGPVQWPQAPAELVAAQNSTGPEILALAQRLDEGGAQQINLLQGDYQIKKRRKASLGPWRWPAIAAGVLLALVVIDKSTQLWQLQAQHQALLSATEQRYREAFPDETRVVNVRAQLNQHLQRLQGGGEQSEFLALMSQLAPAFSTTSLQVSVLQFDSNRNELRVQASAADFMSFEQFVRLAREQQLEVEQGQLNSRGGQISGTVIVRSESG